MAQERAVPDSELVLGNCLESCDSVLLNRWLSVFDESELLLNVTYEYKVEKAAISMNWDSVKGKYDDILEQFRACLPERPASKEQW